MKILKIDITNLASISRATIDLAEGPLAGEPLVLISGPTGAGKSTILDAVCLALYGKTPRLDGRGNDDKVHLDGDDEVSVFNVRNIVRRRCNHGVAAVTIEGNDGERYIAQYTIRQTRGIKGKPGSWQNERSLTRCRDGEVLSRTEAANKIKEVVGMDSAQFFRTTMLAQGDFTAFLRSRTADKATMLERVIGAHHFAEAGKAIFQLHKDAEDGVKSAAQRLAAIEQLCLTAEQKQEINASLVALGETATSLAAEHARLDVAIKWLDTRAEITKRVDALTARLDGQLQQTYRRCADLKQHLDNELASGDGVKVLTERLDLARQAVERKRQTIATLTATFNAMDLDGRQRQRKEAIGRSDALGKLLEAIAGLEQQQQNATTLATAAAQAVADHNAALNSLPQLEQAMQQAINELKQQQEILDKQEIGLEQATRDLRSRLAPGDECPVCGHHIDALLDDSHFESILQPMRDHVKELRERRTRAEADHSAALTVAKQLKRAADAAGRRAADAAEALAATRRRIADDAARLQVQPTRVDAEAARAVINQTISQLDGQIASAINVQQQLTAEGALLNELADAERLCDDDLKKLRRRMSITDNVADALRRVTTAMPAWAGYRPQPVLAVDPESLERDANTLAADVSAATGGIAAERQNLANHLASMPQDVNPQADVNDLRASLATIAVQVTDNQRQSGALQQQLQTDAANCRLRDNAAADVNKANANLARYARLNQCFGSAGGDKFKTIALGFILDDLLHRANHYLRRFDDHYELCNEPGSLVIMLRDRTMDNARSASTNLSGGETFMVSLALALALAQVGDNFVTADTLFIDEGFGTLDDESLERVIDALELLHQMGERRVVLISHVDALQERIAARVTVTDGIVTVDR